jgi:hypothetical protein
MIERKIRRRWALACSGPGLVRFSDVEDLGLERLPLRSRSVPAWLVLSHELDVFDLVLLEVEQAGPAPAVRRRSRPAR